MPQFIRVKRGREYRVTVDEHEGFTDFWVDNADGRVGRAHCVTEGTGRWRLLDIEIYEDSEIIDRRLLQRSSIGSRLRYFFGLGPKLRRNRRFGLGSAILKLIIAHASQRGAKSLRGSIMPHDLEARPYLIHWYQKHGFRRVESEPGDISNVVFEREFP